MKKAKKIKEEYRKPNKRNARKDTVTPLDTTLDEYAEAHLAKVKAVKKKKTPSKPFNWLSTVHMMIDGKCHTFCNHSEGKHG